MSKKDPVIDLTEPALDPEQDAGRPGSVATVLPDKGMIGRTGIALDISKSEATEAAAELGLDVVTIPNVDAQVIIGKYIEQAGAIRMTTGQFLVSNAVRDELIQLCRKRLEKISTTKQLIEIGRFINEVLDSKDAALKIINQAQSAGMIKPVEDRPLNQLPPRGQAITPVQINNSNVTFSPKEQ